MTRTISSSLLVARQPVVDQEASLLIGYAQSSLYGDQWQVNPSFHKGPNYDNIIKPTNLYIYFICQTL